MVRFKDRKDAALQLTKALQELHIVNPIVLGIARGGVEIAYYVSRALDAEFHPLIIQKLRFTDQPELAVGALAEDGNIYLNPDARNQLQEDTVAQLIKQEQQEINRRIERYRSGRSLPSLYGRNVILVDDGIATGATLIAAIEMCIRREASHILAAAPVVASDLYEQLSDRVDEVVVLDTPADLLAISQAYENFTDLTDSDVTHLLKQWDQVTEHREQAHSSQSGGD